MEAKQMIKQTKFGWVDFSNIVYDFNRIQWEKSVKKIINFQYKDINTYLVINKCCEDKLRVNITIPGYIENYDILKSQILYGQLGGVLGKKNPNYLYKIGEVVNQLLILDTYKTASKKYKAYKYRCIIDGYEGHITEDQLKRGQGCPLCANKVVIRGINDLGATAPDIASLLFDKSDQYKYTAHSSKKVYFLCPNCGEKIYAIINDVSRRGLKCHRCGDGFSYPNKFVFNLIKQALTIHANIFSGNFETEKTFDWSKRVIHENNRLSGDKIYDIYIPFDNPIIIENHGAQHFERAYCKNGRTLKEEQMNDTIKKTLAINNGILPDHYIVIDCRLSELEFIKQSVINSNLLQLLNVTPAQIDWGECDKYATSSLVYEACSLRKNNHLTLNEIAITMQISKSTVDRYIKKGKELGLIVN